MKKYIAKKSFSPLYTSTTEPSIDLLKDYYNSLDAFAEKNPPLQTNQPVNRNQERVFPLTGQSANT
jgi:hypothetical protein